jgi:hypothetical protein
MAQRIPLRPCWDVRSLTLRALEIIMVAETIPFNFPRTGRMTVEIGQGGSVAVGFNYLNGHGAIVTKSVGEDTFRLVALNAEGFLDYLPEILGEGVRTLQYLTADEVDVTLTRISNLPVKG